MARDDSDDLKRRIASLEAEVAALRMSGSANAANRPTDSSPFHDLGTLLLDSSRDFITVFDRDARIAFISPGGIRGMDVTDLYAVLGSCWLDLWSGEDRARAQDAVAQTLQGRTGHFQGLAATYASVAKWWDVIVSALPGPTGAAIYLVAVARDITGLIVAERRFRESEENTRLITDALPILISYIDRDGIYRFANAYYEDWFGKHPSDVVGRRVEDVVDPTFYADRRAYIGRALTGEHVRFETARETPTGLRVEDMQYMPRFGAGGRVDGVYVMGFDITQRKRAEDDLRRLATSLEEQVTARTRERDRMWRSSQDLFLVCDLDGVLHALNPAWKDVLGHERSELIGTRVESLAHPEDVAALTEAFRQIQGFGTVRDVDVRLRARDGAYRWLSWHCMLDDDEVYAAGRDVTLRKELEAQLRQAQKMEAVGQLTGGIAHDFNNLLTGIIGSLDLMETRIGQGRYDALDRYIKGAIVSANRAAALTHRLLAFSRRQPLDPRAVDVNALVTSLEDLLRRTMNEQTGVATLKAADLWQTLCDPNQLESAILNLAINARDAMPDGGILTIATSNVAFDRADSAHHGGGLVGDYVHIQVRDTGTGMPPDVIARAFEPFFTTKPIGQGTGLGLSMIYGFARQSDGHAEIVSEFGAGTAVSLFLPRYRGGAGLAADATSEFEDGHTDRGETILVVEDEPLVRTLVAETLMDLGYRTLQAPDGLAALAILDSAQRVDLLVTDVGLPGMNGRQIFDQARGRRPDLRVLFMTGYAENAALAKGALDHEMQVIAKPFASETLAQRVRELIALRG